MKRIWMVVVFILLLGTNAFAGVLAGDVTNNTPIANATAVSAPVTTNVNTNANLNTNTNLQGQMQGQGQVQGQAQKQRQSQTAVGKVTTKVSNNTSINNERELMGTPIAPAIQLPMVSSGIKDFTPELVNIGVGKYLPDGEYVYVDYKKYIFSIGSWLAYSQIYYEDIYPTLLSMKTSSSDAFQVIRFDGQYTVGVMFNGAGGLTGNDGLSSGVGTTGVGAMQGGARPTFLIIKFKKVR